MGTNETTAGTVTGLAPVAVLVEGLCKFFAPGFYEQVPAGTVAAAFLALLSYLMPVGSVIVAKIMGTSVVGLAVGFGLSTLLGGCALIKGGTPEEVRQDVVNVCTGAGKVYRPLQLGMLGAVRSSVVDQDDKEKLLVIDTAAVGALSDCEAAVLAENAAGADAAIAALSAATGRAMVALVGLGVIEPETAPDAVTTEVQ